MRKPGHYPGHFFQNTFQGNWNQAREAHSALNERKRARGGTWRIARSCQSSLGTDTQKMNGGNRELAASHALIIKALQQFFSRLFLLSSHSRNCRGREIWLLVFNIIGLVVACVIRSLLVLGSLSWGHCCSGGVIGNYVNIFSLQGSSVLLKGLITDTKGWTI